MWKEFKIDSTDARTTFLNIDEITVDSYKKVKEALDRVDKAIQTVSKERAKFRSYQNALEHIINNLLNTIVNLTATESRIKDADMALEMTEFTRNNMLNQSVQAMFKIGACHSSKNDKLSGQRNKFYALKS